MATCISRRAHGDHLRFRLINDKGETGKYIWLEFRCSTEVVSEGQVCKGCSYKLPKYKYQANQKCDHGLVGGPYTADSKLYGSPFYLKEIKNGWFVAEQDENRAKAAVDKACSKMAPRKKNVALPLVEPSEPLAPVEPSVPLAPVVPSEPLAPVEPSVPLAPVEKVKRKYTKKDQVTETPVKRKYTKRNDPNPRRKAKDDVALPVIQPVVETAVEAKLVEIVAPPITITDWIVVKVKKIKCQGKDYYYDSISGKLYGTSVNGVGAYKGRYNVEEDTVDSSFPDSDCE